VPPSPVRSASTTRNTPPQSHLPRRRHEAILRQGQPLAEEGSERPGDGCAEGEREARGARCTLASGTDDQCQPGEPGENAQPRPKSDALARERAQEDHLQRHGADDHRGDARVDPRLRERDEADPERQQREPDERRSAELAAGHPDAAALEREDEREQGAG